MRRSSKILDVSVGATQILVDSTVNADDGKFGYYMPSDVLQVEPGGDVVTVRKIGTDGRYQILFIERVQGGTPRLEVGNSVTHIGVEMMTGYRRYFGE